jgi:hypothetical protein
MVRAASLSRQAPLPQTRPLEVAAPYQMVRTNDADTVEVIARAAIASTDERRKMDLLRQLRGVDYRVASTILHFADPDRYMILDVRAKLSLGWDARRDSVELWIRGEARLVRGA